MASVATRAKEAAGAMALVFPLTGCSGLGEPSCVQSRTSLADAWLSAGESVTASAPYQRAGWFGGGGAIPTGS